MKTALPLFAAGMVLAFDPTASAEVPRVVTDMPVVASLVQQVMGDLGQPAALLEAGADPHHYQLRPSQARSLQEAGLLVWIGPQMTPWLERASAGLAAGAATLTLLDLPETHRQDFGAADNDHAHDDPAHGGHADLDPHAWLDPKNAEVWLDAIAKALAAADPEHAATYAANAAAARAALARLDAELQASLAPVAGKPFVVLHDAYGYFTSHYGLPPAIPVSLGDASTPSAARLAETRARVTAEAAVCAFPEANHDPSLIATVIEGTPIREGAALDPEGTLLPPGPDHYPETLRALAQALRNCLG